MQYLNQPYSPIYTAKVAAVEKTVQDTGNSKTFSILPFQDRRGPGGEPLKDLYWVHSEVSLKGKTLMNYLHEALISDLKGMGFKVLHAEGPFANFDELISLKQATKFPTDYVVGIGISILQGVIDTEWMTVQSYSEYDYHLRVWDTNKSQLVVDRHMTKKIMGEKVSRRFYVDMIKELLNDGLSVLNADIAEALSQLEAGTL